MYHIGIIMGGVMPVPAVCGGAIETLITSVVKRYSKEDGLQLTVFSVYHKEAVEVAKKYPEIRFVWTHTNTFWNLAKHAVFMAVRAISGKTIRVLQRHYNEIAPVITTEKFDLLIVEGGDEQAVIDIAKGYKREQLVFHAHIHYIPNENIAKGYGHMIGVSEFVTREYRNACKVPVIAHTLKNAIDIDKFNKEVTKDERKETRNKLGLSEEDFVVLYVGRLIQVKGILELMQAILSIDDEHIKLLVVGSGNFGKLALSSFPQKIKRLAKANQDRIVFTGYVDNSEVYQYAAAADIQCVPTLVEEAAGLVILEAMTEGLPVIVTKSGGVTEYIDDTTALIIERENVTEKLKEAICYLKEHPEVRKQMSEAASVQSNQYDEKTYYKNFVNLVYQIIEENRENSDENERHIFIQTTGNNILAD